MKELVSTAIADTQSSPTLTPSFMNPKQKYPPWVENSSWQICELFTGLSCLHAAVYARRDRQIRAKATPGGGGGGGQGS